MVVLLWCVLCGFLGDDGDRARRTFQFTSQQSPDTLMAGVSSALTDMGFEVVPGGASDPYKAKGSLLTAKGMIGLGLQVPLTVDHTTRHRIVHQITLHFTTHDRTGAAGTTHCRPHH